MSTNERAQEALADLLNMAIDSLEGAQTFAEAQLPDVIEQLLMWKMLESMVPASIAILLWAGAAYLLIGTPAAIRRARKAYDNREEWTRLHAYSEITSPTYDFASLGVPRITPALLIALAGLLMFNLTWLQILVAPKVYLLEYASNLVK